MSCTAMPGGRRRKGGNEPQTQSECAAAGGDWRDGKCEPVPPPMGGRRRSRKGKKTMKGGMGYGFGGPLGTNGPVWNASWGGEITKDGTPIYDTADRPAVTGGRRRKSKKASKKAKKGGKRRRTMRGGAQWQSVAPAGGSFTGAGERGLIGLTGYASRVPVSGGPSQNPDGAYRP
jgi:hypothetical protein